MRSNRFTIDADTVMAKQALSGDAGRNDVGTN